MARAPLDIVARNIHGPVNEGMRLFVYERGTTTEVTGYTTESGGDEVTYPLVADAEGRFPNAWYPPGSYDAYSPDDTVDPVQPIELVRGAGVATEAYADALLSSLAAGPGGSSFSALAANVSAGATSIEVTTLPVGVGRVVIAPYTTNAEVRTIDSVSGTTVGLTSALSGSHVAGVGVMFLPPSPISLLEFGDTAVDDWGALINGAFAEGVRQFMLEDLSHDHSGTAYEFSTPINHTALTGVQLMGPGGTNDHYGLVATQKRMPAYLLWTGDGATSPIIGPDSAGVIFRNLGIYYASNLFTGRLVDWRNSVAVSHLRDCHLGSLDDLYSSALANVDLGLSWQDTIERCSLRGADWNVLGSGGSTFCDTHRIIDSNFSHADIAHLGGIGKEWDIDKNFFGMGLTGAVEIVTPAVIDTPAGAGGAYFTFSNNSVWDAHDQPGAWFKQPAGAPWYATFEGNMILAETGPLFHLQGGGVINIVNNPSILIGDLSAVVDCGGSGADTKDVVRVVGNRFATENEPVIGTNNVRDLDVHANDAAPYAFDRRTMRGHERLGWVSGTYLPRPTIAAETALGSGGTAAISGMDLAGVITLNTGGGHAAGKQATITLGTPLVTDPLGLGTLLVQVWVLDRGSNDPDVEVTSGIFSGGTASWQLFFKHPSTVGTVYVGYRVLGL